VNLLSQLDELRRAVLRDFSTQVSGATDQLWSDDQLVRYIADAERRWCRQTFCLRDADTPAYTQIPLVAGVGRYVLDPLILAVISARYHLDSFDLKRIGRSLVAEVGTQDSLWFDPGDWNALSPGRPDAYSTDELLTYQSQARGALTLYPAPSPQQDGLMLFLRVARNTLRDYTDLESESEISDNYVYDVLEWAAYRALRNHDADAADPAEATAHKTAFEEAVEKCKGELRSMLFGQTQYVFGMNGFVWER
jgi:hypothetical protein